jgi:hypothetical protein
MRLLCGHLCAGDHLLEHRQPGIASGGSAGRLLQGPERKPHHREHWHHIREHVCEVSARIGSIQFFATSPFGVPRVLPFSAERFLQPDLSFYRPPLHSFSFCRCSFLRYVLEFGFLCLDIKEVFMVISNSLVTSVRSKRVTSKVKRQFR